MVVRKCHKCGAVWRSELSQCAFCGVEGEEQGRPEVALAVLERPNGSSHEPEPPAPEFTKDVPKQVAKLPGSFAIQAPRLPSALVPLSFGILGISAAALLPLATWVSHERVADVLLFLGVALLAPFAPLAWWTGWRYDTRCADLGFRPSIAARAGRLLGVAVTLLLTAEGSALAFLRALQRLRE